jgi:sec-independent protein translocase protein TatB
VFGINGGELIILLLVVALVVGPERLPAFAEQLGRWVRGLRQYVSTAKDRVDAELGDTGLDWEALDPRRYDPRRIVREALLDEPAPTQARRYPAPRSVPAPVATPGPAPYDDEAT